MPRTRSFDTDAALDRALRLFWRHGYEGTSIEALTAELGIGKPSLYAAFGNKRALFELALDRYAAIESDAEALEALDFQSEINLLKVDASELAVSAVTSALRCGGLSSYRNDSDVSIGRHLRDVLSAPIMINNDRILANVAASALLTEVPATVRG